MTCLRRIRRVSRRMIYQADTSVCRRRPSTAVTVEFRCLAVLCRICLRRRRRQLCDAWRSAMDDVGRGRMPGVVAWPAADAADDLYERLALLAPCQRCCCRWPLAYSLAPCQQTGRLPLVERRPTIFSRVSAASRWEKSLPRYESIPLIADPSRRRVHESIQLQGASLQGRARLDRIGQCAALRPFTRPTLDL